MCPPFQFRKPALVAVLAAAAAFRLFYALSAGYFVDEDTDWIWLAETISFDPGALNLPLHYQHPALPAYLIKLSGALFGHDIFGFRVLSLIAGLLTIWIAYAFAKKHFGETAGLWAAALLAFNEFHIAMSSLALLDSYYFLFSLASVWFFVEYLCDRQPWKVCMAAFLLGLAFLCYEIASLVGLAYAVILLFPPYRERFRDKALYAAAAIGILTVAPDLYWSLGFAQSPDGAATYAMQLSRAHGLGFNFSTFGFFFRDPMRAVLEATGRTVIDPVEEYPAMNAVLGILMLAATCLVTLRRRFEQPARLALIVVFGTVLGAITVLRTTDFGTTVEFASWMWVDVILFPAAILTGAWIAKTSGVLRATAVAVVVVGCLLSTFSLFRDQFGTQPALVFIDPQNIWPADGRTAEVTAEISHCALCDPADTRLEAVRTASFETDVEGADIGTDDRQFRLRAGKTGQSYTVYYSVTDPLGRRRMIHSQPVVVAEWVLWNKPPFWSEAARRN